MQMRKLHWRNKVLSVHTRDTTAVCSLEEKLNKQWANFKLKTH